MKMGAMTPNGNAFSHISVRELHPSFGAEIGGVDFGTPLSEDVFAEIHRAVTKVSNNGMLHAKRGSSHI